MNTKADPRERFPGYKVMVDDNFFYMDEDERYCAGVFATHEEAVAAAKRIVEAFFESEGETRKAGTPEALYDEYTSFGKDPFIVAVGGAPAMPLFSAWNYARELTGCPGCPEIAPPAPPECGETGSS